MMIHGNSTDPVLVKKISLRIWRLRDEVEAVVEEKLSSSEDGSIEDLTSLKDEYDVRVLGSTINDDPGSEDTGEEESSEAPEEEQSTEASEESVTVKQRRPQIPEDKIIKGISILSEIGMDNIYLFCNQQMMPGQSVVIDFVIPKRFVVNAEVAFCRPYNMKSRIISENKLPYRCALKFTFLKEGERTLLRQFLESIEPEIEAAKQGAEVAKSAAKADDDLGDLDDLDL